MCRVIFPFHFFVVNIIYRQIDPSALISKQYEFRKFNTIRIKTYNPVLILTIAVLLGSCVW